MYASIPLSSIEQEKDLTRKLHRILLTRASSRVKLPQGDGYKLYPSPFLLAQELHQPDTFLSTQQSLLSSVNGAWEFKLWYVVRHVHAYEGHVRTVRTPLARSCNTNSFTKLRLIAKAGRYRHTHRQRNAHFRRQSRCFIRHLIPSTHNGMDHSGSLPKCLQFALEHQYMKFLPLP